MDIEDPLDFTDNAKVLTFEKVRQEAIELAPSRANLETILFMIDSCEKHGKTVKEAHKAMIKMFIFNLYDNIKSKPKEK